MTAAETVLWRELRNRRLGGLKFRRQHPFGPFVVDFCCPEARLVVEMDGEVHDAQAEQDEARTQILGSYGFRVFRFRNEAVLQQLDEVLREIIDAIGQSHDLHERSPLSRARERGRG